MTDLRTKTPHNWRGQIKQKVTPGRKANDMSRFTQLTEHVKKYDLWHERWIESHISTTKHFCDESRIKKITSRENTTDLTKGRYTLDMTEVTSRRSHAAKGHLRTKDEWCKEGHTTDWTEVISGKIWRVTQAESKRSRYTKHDWSD